MKYLKILSLLGIMVAIFSCGKDDEDMGGGNQKICTLKSVYQDGALYESYIVQSENTYRRNFYDTSGSLTGYYIFTKNNQGNVTRRSYFNVDGALSFYTQYLYRINQNSPYYLEDYSIVNTDSVFVGGLDLSPNVDGCGRERLSVVDEDYFTFFYIDYAYLDDNCSHAYRGYAVNSNTLEAELVYEKERIYDSRNVPRFAFLEHETSNKHNALSVTNKDGDVLERSSVFQYNDEGYPTSEERSVLQNDGSIMVTNYTYEYLCE